MYSTDFGEGEIIVQYKSRLNNNEIEVMERKGWGHPDKLADDLAEELSRSYSRYTIKKCGAVLHHNFDKLCLIGGNAKVGYGSSQILQPIKVLVNGRASKSFGDTILDVDNLITTTCKEFFKSRLPLLDVDKDLDICMNVNISSSPGGVKSNDASPRHRWFNPKTLEDLPEYNRLYANDTSLGTGFAPYSTTERLVILLNDYLSKRPRKDCPIWLGTDVKIMAYSFNNKVDLTICAPQISLYVKSREEYIKNLKWLEIDIQNFISSNFPNIEAEINLNARDKIDLDEVYLTATGSSIESGDEGVVGRGNRINGLITPMRPMNLEGANGKNPVYHIGKIYNVLANIIAERLYEHTGKTVYVNLISKTGGDLLTPWKVIIQIQGKEENSSNVVNIVKKLCQEIPELTNKIISSSIQDMPLS
ncbi:MAG: methionine adenosyltransferase [Rickettsiaceae bacterium]